MRIVFAVLGGAISYFACVYRFLSYSERNRLPGSAWLALAGACFCVGFAAAFGLRNKPVRMGHFVVAGVLLSLAVTIGVDWHHDPTDHNLFPFEVVIVGVTASPAYLGALLTRFASKPG